MAFTAAATSHQEVETGERYVFANVMTTVGGGYDADSSEFICPLDGYYMFTISIRNQLGEGAWARVTVEGVQGPRAFADSRNDGEAGHATSIHFTHCTQGQKVWVENFNSPSILYGNNYSSFSGMLVNAAPASADTTDY